MRTPSVVAVALVLLTGCSGPAGRTEPDAITTSPSTPVASLTPEPSPQPASSRNAKPAATGGVAKTRKPSAPPPSSAAAGIHGELALDGPPACWWVPKAFLNGDGGISVVFTVRSQAVSQATTIDITVVGGSGERGQTTAKLPRGNGQQHPSVITNADEGSYEAHLTVSLDPSHHVRQAGYADDVATIRAVIPFPRPSTTSVLSCYMVS